MLQDRLPQAQKDAEQAIALQEKLQIPVDVATSRLTLAEVTLEQGHPADALALARKSSSELAALKTDDRVAIADTTIARGLLALRRLDEAGTAIKRATGSPATQASRQIRINAVIAAARLKIASGDLAGAIIDLDKVLAEPAPLALHLEARLALAEARRSRAELRALEKEARGKGFALIARKAHNALEPH